MTGRAAPHVVRQDQVYVSGARAVPEAVPDQGRQAGELCVGARVECRRDASLLVGEGAGDERVRGRQDALPQAAPGLPVQVHVVESDAEKLRPRDDLLLAFRQVAEFGWLVGHTRQRAGPPDPCPAGAPDLWTADVVVEDRLLAGRL
ncbi:hypothetical protein O7600_11490 [Micromonospora sp. WMMA1998]|nr:hypothetical protein [Micromonospora sp. WMMA1998]WBC17411.1 hypothetical protein O7600_11490 [Micromonospora sp. WMMA1998]